MKLVSELHQEWLNEPKCHETYEALEPEFSQAREVIATRVRAFPLQERLAQQESTNEW